MEGSRSHWHARGCPGSFKKSPFTPKPPVRRRTPRSAGFGKAKSTIHRGAKPGSPIGTRLQHVAAVPHAGVHRLSAWGLLSA